MLFSSVTIIYQKLSLIECLLFIRKIGQNFRAISFMCFNILRFNILLGQEIIHYNKKCINLLLWGFFPFVTKKQKPEVQIWE